jgi:hypothetical protein
VGFSPKSEQAQREILKPFIVSCHQRNLEFALSGLGVATPAGDLGQHVVSLPVAGV